MKTTDSAAAAASFLLSRLLLGQFGNSILIGQLLGEATVAALCAVLGGRLCSSL